MVFALTLLLLAGMVFVNGWTDAPNAIGTAVGTRALSPRAAVILAGVCNLLGVAAMALTRAKVMETVMGAADFGGDSGAALTALMAAMLAVVVFAVGAWAFGIPTSEGHALIAGLTGAALALSGPGAVNPAEWNKVIIGLLVSGGLGLAGGFLLTKLTAFLCRKRSPGDTRRFFRWGQAGAAGAMAFLHGAQDGQKFIGAAMLALHLNGIVTPGPDGRFTIPLGAAALTALVMGLGTLLGGGRIIRKVGMELTKLRPYQGFASDLAGGLCLLLSTLTGLPVSTTHTKTAAVMGAGAARSVKGVDWRIAGQMALAWLLTFPCCGAIGYGMGRVLMHNA